MFRYEVAVKVVAVNAVKMFSVAKLAEERPHITIPVPQGDGDWQTPGIVHRAR
jgi:hypothetical protein